MTDPAILLLPFAFLLLLVGGALVLHGLERAVPALGRWLDSKIGEDPTWMQPW